MESKIGSKLGNDFTKDKDTSKSGEPKVQECPPGDQPDREGMKAYKVLGSRFELPDFYEIIEPVGSGAYGVVVAVKDKSSEGEEAGGNLVAIKKIEKAFDHKVFALRTLRELKIMRLLDHDNILSIQSILMPESLENFDQIYVVTELMETDLSQIIKSS